MSFSIRFIDSGREPKCAPNPAFPDGMHLDVTKGEENWCKAKVPYPSPRCGVLMIQCDVCGLTVAVTVAGRVDDVRSIKLPCKVTKH